MGDRALRTLADQLKLEFEGDGDTRIGGVASIDSATEGELSFVTGRRYLESLGKTRAGAVLLPRELADHSPCACLLSDNPQADFARAALLLHPPEKPAPGISEAAHVASDASLAEGVHVAASAVIEAGARLGDDVVIEAGAVVGAGAEVGARSRIGRNCVITDRVRIGQDCRLHPGVVLGGDGFGFVPEDGAWTKVPQLGGVRIDDRVEIGANTTVDRGAIEDTVIESGVKLDNQVQIAHNVRIGADTIIAGCTAVAGSVDIGESCTIAGGVGIAGHLTICPGVTITAMTLVSRSIARPGVYSGSMPMDESSKWRRNSARIRQLDDMARRMGKLEK